MRRLWLRASLDRSESDSVSRNEPKSRLISWKEIAHYLQCEERTAQRWEQERGLPVHRVPGDRRGTVYCFEHELAAWLHQQPTETLVANGVQSAAGVTREDPGVAASPPTTFLGSLRGPQRIRLILWAGFLLVVATAFWLGGIARSHSVQAPKDRVPAKYEYAGADLIIQNRFGETLWSHRFDGPLRISDDATAGWRRIQFDDLDGDGTTEVVAAVGHSDNLWPDRDYQSELYCFESDGKLRWRYHFSETLTFGGQKFAPPYTVNNLLITGDRRKHVWVVYVHQPWWPGILLKLDDEGREGGRFVNVGYIYSLAHVRHAGGSYILAGGVNNEYDAGMVAVLDTKDSDGHSPQTTGSRYECGGCPNKLPLRYFVFPRSELNRATASPYNAVYQLRRLSDRLDVITLETQADPAQRSESHFEFDLDFRLVGAHRGDAYWNVHHILPHMVHHPADKCPERTRSITVREWQSGNWRDIYPQQTFSQIHLP